MSRDRFRLPGWPGRAREHGEPPTPPPEASLPEPEPPPEPRAPPEPPLVPEPPAPEPVAPEPTVPEPVAAEPTVPEAVFPEPYVPEPVVPEPYVPDPVVPEPYVPDPVVSDPVVAEPYVPEPVVPESYVPEPLPEAPAREPPAALEPEAKPPDREPEQRVPAQVRPPSRRASAMDSENRPHLRTVGDGDSIESEGALARQPDPARSDGITPPTRRGGSGRFLTDVIVEMNFVERPVVETAIEAARTAGRAPEQVLREQGALSQDQLARVVAERFGLDHVDLTLFDVDMGAANADQRRRPPSATTAVPVALRRRRARCSSRWPTRRNVLAVDDIAIMTGLRGPRRRSRRRGRPRRCIARLNRLDDVVAGGRRGGRRRGRRRGRRPARVRRATRRSSSSCTRSSPRRSSRARRTSTSSPREATCACASASTACSPSRPRSRAGWSPGVVSRIKIMADLDISERRVPQDGRVGADRRGPPDRHPRRHAPAASTARRVVLRILDKDDVRRSSSSSSACRRSTRSASRPASPRPTAPCWSPARPARASRPRSTRRSTQLNTTEKNIITIEDPVEYQIDGHQPDPGQPEGRPDVRHRPALDAARGPRRDHGRRDPRRARRRTIASRPR